MTRIVRARRCTSRPTGIRIGAGVFAGLVALQLTGCSSKTTVKPEGRRNPSSTSSRAKRDSARTM